MVCDLQHTGMDARPSTRWSCHIPFGARFDLIHPVCEPTASKPCRAPHLGGAVGVQVLSHTRRHRSQARYAAALPAAAPVLCRRDILLGRALLGRFEFD